MGEKGYTVLNYVTEDGGQVESLTEEQLEEAIEGIDSEKIKEEIRELYDPKDD